MHCVPEDLKQSRTSAIGAALLWRFRLERKTKRGREPRDRCALDAVCMPVEDSAASSSTMHEIFGLEYSALKGTRTLPIIPRRGWTLSRSSQPFSHLNTSFSCLLWQFGYP